MNCSSRSQKSSPRRGYTTGSCAAAAAVAAARMLLGGEKPRRSVIELPSGQHVSLDVEDCRREKNGIIASVRKDAGDDPDVTQGFLIRARVALQTEGMTLEGGEGVGRVCAPGLACAPGQAAINPVPRKMVEGNLASLCRLLGYEGGLHVEISVPGGEEIARKTYNSRLGIRGGISILGTTGFVEPMSTRAVIETVRLFVSQAKTLEIDPVVLVPGNYGMNFASDRLGIARKHCIKCSNYIGEALDELVRQEVRQTLLVGHPGKLVKLAGGIMNTHSAVADCRREILGVYSALSGAGRETLNRIMTAGTTDEILGILEEKQLKQKVLQSVMERMRHYIDERTGGSIRVEIIVYDAQHRIAAATQGAMSLANQAKGDGK